MKMTPSARSLLESSVFYSSVIFISAKHVHNVPPIITAIVMYCHTLKFRFKMHELNISANGTDNTWKNSPKSGEMTAMLTVKV